MTLTRFLERRSEFFIYLSGLLVVLLLGVLDYLNGPVVSLLIFYTAPVFVAAWRIGRGAGFVMCAASGLVWFAAAAFTHAHYAHPLIAYWNAAVRLAFMLILAHLVAAFKKSLEHEREMARTDHLTGTFNGRHFAETAAGEISRARRHGHPFTVAYMDVDDFKQVNDRFGHSAGDRLLRTVADTVRENVRGIDVVARLGGDEFAVLMPETDGAAADVVIRRIRRRLLDATRAGGWPVTFSIGVVTFDAPPASCDEMLKAADELMYSAKRRGKNSIRHRVEARPATAA